MRIALLATLAACQPPSPTVPDEGRVVRAEPVSPPESVALPSLLPPIPFVRASGRDGSTLVLAHRDLATLAMVADADAGEPRVVDIDRGFELAALELGGHPAQLVMLADHRIAVALRDRDEIAIVRARDLAFAVEQRVAVAREPIGLALSPDDRTLVVTSGWGHTLTALDIAPERLAAVTRTWPLAAEPRAVILSDDGRRAFGSHAIGGHVEVVDLAGKVTRCRSRA
jgi:hypothetical protein